MVKKDKIVRRKLEKQIVKLIEDYLKEQVITPSHETIEKDVFALNRLGSILKILDISIPTILKNGTTFDKDYLCSLPTEDITKRIESLNYLIELPSSEPREKDPKIEEALKFLKEDSSNKIWLSYFNREINFIVVSILSGAYLGANILMRSNFELLINILFKRKLNKIENLEFRSKINNCDSLSTEEKEKIIMLWEKDENYLGMSKKINNIPYFSVSEKRDLKKQWGRLSNWVHFSKDWEKKICPNFLLHKPMYHPALCKNSIEELEGLIDLLLVTAIVKYEVDIKYIQSEAGKYGINLSDFPLIRNRIELNGVT